MSHQYEQKESGAEIVHGRLCASSSNLVSDHLRCKIRPTCRPSSFAIAVATSYLPLLSTPSPVFFSRYDFPDIFIAPEKLASKQTINWHLPLPAAGSFV
jgi:hypothetical protein